MGQWSEGKPQWVQPLPSDDVVDLTPVDQETADMRLRAYDAQSLAQKVCVCGWGGGGPYLGPK